MGGARASEHGRKQARAGMTARSSAATPPLILLSRIACPPLNGGVGNVAEAAEAARQRRVDE